MFELTGAGYGILSPLYLVLAPLIVAALLYAYRRGGRGREIAVATLLIFKKLTHQTKNRQKIIPPLRFFIELLVLLALCLAAAGLFKVGYSDRYAVLIDNSFSMNASAKDSSGQEKLIDIAKRDSETFLGGLSSQIGVAVYVTSPELRSVTDGTVSVSAAQRAIEDIRIVNAADNIETAISNLVNVGSFKKIAIFSQKPPVSNETENATLLFRSSADLVAPKKNVAIISARVEPAQSTNPSLKVGTARLGVSIAAYTTETVKAQVSIEMLDKLSSGMKFTNIKTEEISLAAGAIKSISYDLPQSEAYQVSLITPPDALWDSLIEDNKAFLALEPRKDEGLLISAFSRKDLGLDRIAKFPIKTVSPKEWNGDIKGYRYVIFHNVVPESLPKINSLYINPQSSGPFFDISAEVVSPQYPFEIASWSDSHPLTAYLNLPLLTLKTLHPMTPKNGASAIINSTAGPVLVAAEQEGARHAALSFELLPYKGSGSPLLSVMTLNLLKWLSGTSISLGFEAVPFNLKKQKVSLEQVVKGGSSQDSASSIVTPGIYELSDDSLMALNYFSESESDTFTIQQFAIPAAKVKNISNPKDDKPFAKSIIFAALVLIALDLLYLLYKASFKRRRLRV